MTVRERPGVNDDDSDADDDNDDDGNDCTKHHTSHDDDTLVDSFRSPLMSESRQTAPH